MALYHEMAQIRNSCVRLKRAFCKGKQQRRRYTANPCRVIGAFVVS